MHIESKILNKVREEAFVTDITESGFGYHGHIGEAGNCKWLRLQSHFPGSNSH